VKQGADLSWRWPRAQYPPTPPPPPKPAETPNPAEIRSNPQAIVAAKRALLQQNEKEFRVGVERLYQLTSEIGNFCLLVLHF